MIDLKILKKFPGLNLFLEKIKMSFWLIPSFFTISSFLLFLFNGHLSDWFDKYLNDVLKVKPFSAEGAQQLLSTSAGALMTVVGVMFSITVVVLQQVSQQYSPRIISSFIKSRSSQTVLGAFMGTFLYNVLLLADIYKEQVIQAPVYVAIVMILVCIGLLVHFIHHISHAIQSTSIIKDLRESAIQSYENFQNFVEKRQGVVEVRFENRQFIHIKAGRYGYIQGISIRELNDIRLSKSISISLLKGIGDIVDEDTDLWRVEGEFSDVDDIRKKLENVVLIGNSRSSSQDIRFGIRQLVDIALKALSPGINDPSTAIESLNSITYVLKCYFKYPCQNEPLVINDNFILNLKFASSEEAIRLSYCEIIEASVAYTRVLRKVKDSIENVYQFANLDQKRILDLYLKKVESVYREADARELDEIESTRD